MDAKAATGIGTPLYVKDFRHIVVTINSAGSANLTVKAVGAISEAFPDFTAAQSPTNRYDFINMRDYEDNSKVDGDDGLVLSGTDDQRMFELNTNGLTWINFRITARVAGNVTIKAVAFNDS
jgi:hypothetical protein